MEKEQEVHISTIDEKIKEHFTEDISFIYKKWNEKTYDLIAEKASQKTQFAYLPVEMLVYILDIYETVELEKKTFELLNYDGCKEYINIKCKKAPLIIEKLKRITLEKSHIASLSNFATNTLLEKNRIDDAISLIKVLLEKDEAYTRRCILKKISLYIYFIFDYKLNIEDVLKLVEFVESMGRLSKDLKKAISKVKQEILSLQTRNVLNDITKKVYGKIKHEWSEFYSWENEDTLFYCIGDPLDTYVNNNYEKSLVSLLEFINKKTTDDFQKILATKLLVSLANGLVNRASDVNQNKAKIAYNLYKLYPVFRKATEEYAIYIPKLISNLFSYSFFSIDQDTLVDVHNKCILKYNGTMQEDNLLEYISDELKYNHNFSNLITIDNVNLYWKISECIDLIFPKLHFYETSDGEKLLSIKNDINKLNELDPLIENLTDHVYWLETPSLPEYLEFEYLYPNGSNGDMIKYILEEYGQTKQKYALLWYGKISKEYLNIFELFASSAGFISSDPRFLKIYDNYIPTILNGKTGEINYHVLSKFSTVKQKIDNLLSEHNFVQKQKRAELYAKLVLENRTTPKWKSEAQLYSLVASLYPDAVYQYKDKWLGMQSLDIFIPSLSIGIEYQGIQHYVPIEHFGGEKHFKHQQENDRKKLYYVKKMVCI